MEDSRQEASAGVELWRAADPDQLAISAADLFVELGTAAINGRGRFVVALAGGNTPRRAYTQLSREPWRSRLDWNRTYLFWGDERCVPPDHPDSNYRMARESLIDAAGLPPENIFRIPAESPDPQQAALDYEATLRAFFGPSNRTLPRFDLILLGLGDDGHTASLFPGTAAVAEQQRLVVAVWVEKLKAHRITLTLPVLNAARTVVFLVSGANKAAILRQVLEPSRAAVPAQQVRPNHGRMIWLVDREAASQLDRLPVDVVVRELGADG